MSTPLDTPMDTDSASPQPHPRARDPLTLLTTALAQYPIIRLLAIHLHNHAALVKLMLTSRAIYHTIAPSRTAIKSFTCRASATERTFGCWCCGVPVCPYCCYEVFLPRALAPDTHWPTEDDKKYNDKSIRNPACRYEFSDAKRCCLRCYRKPAWWVREVSREKGMRYLE